jgi:hypothetical protein
MKKSIRMRSVFAVAFGFLVFLASCSRSATESTLALPKGEPSPVSPAPPQRRLCIALTPAPGKVTLDDAYKTATALGMTEPGDINFDWNRVEPNRGQRIDPDGEIDALKRLYKNAKSATLTLAPIQTTTIAVPNDLLGRPWDDAELINRYLTTLDAVLAALEPLPIRVVAVGNEVDVVLGSDAEAMRQFATLVQAVNTHLEPRGIRVGSKLTWNGVQTAAARPILAASDLAIVSYYPIGVDADPWRVRPVDVVESEIDLLVSSVAPKAVYLAEVGYPSASSLGSSPEAQAAFVDRVFDAWDRHPTIEGMCVVWLFDLGPKTRASLIAQYGIADQGFADYLGTLGLITENGVEKPAMATLRNRAARLR